MRLSFRPSLPDMIGKICSLCDGRVCVIDRQDISDLTLVRLNLFFKSWWVQVCGTANSTRNTLTEHRGVTFNLIRSGGSRWLDTRLEYPTCPRQALWKCYMPQRVGEGSNACLKTKIYNLETDEFVSNPPFLKTNLAGVISQPTFGREQLELI